MPTEATTRQLVVFTLGSEEYALPIRQVHEIIRYTEPRTVVSDAAWIRGVIGLRGKIIPIFDLASRMELDAVPAAGSPSIEAIAKIDDRLVILLDPEGIFAGADVAAA